MLRASERRAYDVVTGPDGPRHGFVVELPDGTLSPRKDWVAIALTGFAEDGQPGFQWLGRYRNPRDGYDAILRHANIGPPGLDGCVCPGPDTCAGPPCASAPTPTLEASR